MLRCSPKPGTTLPPPCSHTPSEAPAPAHCEPARRAQMCLMHGQAGSRGSADPWKAYGAEYHVGIVDEQVCSALPLVHIPGMPSTDRTPCCADFAERAPASPRANPDVSGRLWHVLREERTHGLCVCVLRARDAEHFACRGSFVCVHVLVDMSTRVRCIVVANL